MLNEVEKVGYPIGWTNDSWQKWSDGVESADKASLFPVLGWFITAIAMTLGASFWFGLLNRLVSLRTSLPPKEDEVEKKTSQTQQRRNKSRQGEERRGGVRRNLPAHDLDDDSMARVRSIGIL
ncbi:MAG: hypothetical protein ACLP4V_15660 [Methylocella sp.]